MLAPLTALVLAAFALAADPPPPVPPADPPAAPPAVVKGHLPLHWRQIGLTDAQKAQVYAIEAKHKAAIDKLEQQLADEKAAEKQELDALLTDGQKTALKAALEKGLNDAPSTPPPSPTTTPKP